MLVDYRLNAKHLPSERDVWLMSRRVELDGHEISRPILNAMATGDIKYVDGKFYRLCRHCMDYLELDKFHENKRYVLDVNYVCKPCMAARRRIKLYGVASYVSDVGMKEPPHAITFHMTDENKKIITRRMEDGCDK